MAEKSTIARPYAHAVFELARQSEQLKQWSEMLEYAVAVARDPTMSALLGSPRLTRDELSRLFLDICGDHLNEEGRNLVRLLAENRRLDVLSEIRTEYETLRAQEESVLEARIISAKPVGEEMRGQLAEALSKRLDRKVALTCETDENILGGAIIRAGDLVIDGSVRGRLESLSFALSR